MTSPKSEEQLLLLANLVVHWNNVENHIREILAILSPDGLTARLLSADLQTANLISVTRMMAKERQSMNDRINMALKEKRRKVKLYERFLEDVEFLLNVVDAFREYRNYYVHGAIRLGNTELQLLKVSARKRFAISGAPFESEKVESLVKQLIRVEEYAALLIDALTKNNSSNPALRANWPKRPAALHKLKWRRIIFDGALPSVLEA